MTPTLDVPSLDDRITGSLLGAAVGDALGGPVEGYTPEQILERHGGRVTGIVGPWNGGDWRTARPIAPYHKGDGHVTDDTLMTHALIRVYEKVRGHLDAYAVAERLVPELMGSPVWIPELEAEALPLQRIFLAEKWIVARLHYGHVDPREAGNGNIVNCGAAMYMAPVGLVNAAHPAAAYAEALDIAGAHQSSYGREAAGVFAAAVAAACAPHATPTSVVETALSLAKDGTRSAIEAVAEVASRHTDFESALTPLRKAVAPFDTVGPDYRSPPSAPAAPPGSTRSRSCRSPWACCSSARASSGVRSSAPSTTAATATRSPPWRARSSAPCTARRRSPRSGRSGSRRRAGSICTPRRPRWPGWPVRSSPGTRSCAGPTSRRSRR